MGYGRRARRRTSTCKREWRLSQMPAVDGSPPPLESHAKQMSSFRSMSRAGGASSERPPGSDPQRSYS